MHPSRSRRDLSVRVAANASSVPGTTAASLAPAAAGGMPKPILKRTGGSTTIGASAAAGGGSATAATAAAAGSSRGLASPYRSDWLKPSTTLPHGPGLTASATATASAGAMDSGSADPYADFASASASWTSSRHLGESQRSEGRRCLCWLLPQVTAAVPTTHGILSPHARFGSLPIQLASALLLITCSGRCARCCTACCESSRRALGRCKR